MTDLALVPVNWQQVVEFIGDWHRHHDAPPGHKFSIGVADGTVLVGVAVVGRPIAASFDDGTTLEVRRTATDGTANANSMLYGATWRAAKALGYRRLVTYTEGHESGASLRAAGWRVIAHRPPRPGWSSPSRPREQLHCPHCGRGAKAYVQRMLWEAS